MATTPTVLVSCWQCGRLHTPDRPLQTNSMCVPCTQTVPVAPQKSGMLKAGPRRKRDTARDGS